MKETSFFFSSSPHLNVEPSKQVTSLKTVTFVPPTKVLSHIVREKKRNIPFCELLTWSFAHLGREEPARDILRMSRAFPSFLRLSARNYQEFAGKRNPRTIVNCNQHW